MGVAVLHNLQRRPLVDSRHVSQQRPRRRIEVHSDPVHAGFHRGFQALFEPLLVDVVLVLPYADRLGVHLHQLRERVLQAAGNRDGPADGQIEIRKLLPGDLRGRIDRSTRFAHRDAEDFRQGCLAQKILHECRRFTGGRAVADGHGLHIMAGDQRGQRLHRSRQVVFRLEGIDDGVLQKLARIVHHGEFAAGANPRVNGEDGQHARRRRQQQIFQVLAKDLDGLFVRAVLQFQAHFGLDGRVEQPVVGIFNSLFEVRHPLARRADHMGAQPCEGLQRVQLDFETEQTFLGAAANRQHAMRRNLARRFAVLGVDFELAFGILGPFDGTADHYAIRHHHAADGFAELGILADPLRDDVTGALQGFGRGADAFFFADEGIGQVGERGGAGLLIPKKLGERFEALIASDGGLGPALGLVRKVQIFEFGLLQRRLDAGLQFRTELALLLDGLEDRFPALLQFPEVLQLLLDVTDLDFIQVAGDFLAVPRDERHRGPFVEESDDRHHALEGHVEQFGDMNENRGGKRLKLCHGPENYHHPTTPALAEARGQIERRPRSRRTIRYALANRLAEINPLRRKNTSKLLTVFIR